GGVFVAVWRAKEDQVGLDPEGRLVDTVIANTLVESITGHIGKVIEYKQEPKKKAQPRAYSLSDITLLASNKFGYSAADVLEVCQSLYETHKLTSYPRTDCGYLPESQPSNHCHHCQR
ncbi:DNA topoisomerase, partial [Xylella fastidiosa]